MGDCKLIIRKMKVINPINKEIKVKLFGTDYTIKAEGELTGVPIEHARYWQGRLHHFLVVEEESTDKVSRLGIADEKDTEVEEIEVDLMELTRPQLNEVAIKSGIRQPEEYQNKKLLVEAILKLDE